MHIYKWTHKKSGKSYIGQSIQDPERRRYEHERDAKVNECKYRFHNALRKYGIDAFTWEVIDTASTLEELNELEDFYINKYNSIINGYNLRQGGDNKLHSDESKIRMSEAQKAAHARRRLNGTEGGWTRKDGGPMKGKKCTASAKQKIGTANSKHYKGKTWEEIYGVEGAKKRREAMKERAEKRRIEANE